MEILKPIMKGACGTALLCLPFLQHDLRDSQTNAKTVMTSYAAFIAIGACAGAARVIADGAQHLINRATPRIGFIPAHCITMGAGMLVAGASCFVQSCDTTDTIAKAGICAISLIVLYEISNRSCLLLYEAGAAIAGWRLPRLRHQPPDRNYELV